MYAELGLMDRARTVFEELASNEFMHIQQDGVGNAGIGDRRGLDRGAEVGQV